MKAIPLRHVEPYQTAGGIVVHIDNAPTIDAAYPQRVKRSFYSSYDVENAISKIPRSMK